MIKKLLLIITFFVTSISFGQYTINFDEAVPTYTIGQQGTGQTTADKAANPTSTGNPSGGDVLRFTINSNIGFWAYPFLGLGSGGTHINTLQGKFFTLQIISPIATGSVYLYPWIGGTKQAAIIANFTGASSTEWKTLEFDLTSAPEGYLSRMDFEFHTGSNLVAGDVYYIDNIKQLTISTLSLKNYELLKITTFPNPAKKTISIGSEKENIKEVKIYDITGKEVKSFKGHLNLDISNLQPGLYLIKTDTGRLAKFIKQ